jgi:hypothetical protein
MLSLNTSSQLCDSKAQKGVTTLALSCDSTNGTGGGTRPRAAPRAGAGAGAARRSAGRHQVAGGHDVADGARAELEGVGDQVRDERRQLRRGVRACDDGALPRAVAADNLAHGAEGCRGRWPTPDASGSGGRPRIGRRGRLNPSRASPFRTWSRRAKFLPARTQKRIEMHMADVDLEIRAC